MAATGLSLDLVCHQQDIESIKQTGIAIWDSAPNSVVRYVTVEELMRLHRPHRLRVELLAVWCLLIAAFLGLSQLWRYQHGLLSNRTRQDSTISQLGTKLGHEDVTIRALKSDLVIATSDVNSRMDAMQRISIANDRVTRQLLDRVNELEVSRTISQTGAAGALTIHGVDSGASSRPYTLSSTADIRGGDSAH